MAIPGGAQPVVAAFSHHGVLVTVPGAASAGKRGTKVSLGQRDEVEIAALGVHDLVDTNRSA